MQASDKKLVQQIQAGDSAAFEVLFNRYQGQVRSRLLRIVNDVATAEDLMQEAFLRVWNRSSQWNGEGPFPAWLQRIATNLAISHLRRVRRRREQSFEMAPGPLDEEGESPPEWLVEASDPGPELTLDQLGLPEEMAWMLFGPQVAQQLNDSQAVEQRTAAAAQKLDALMADAWVLFFGGHNFCTAPRRCPPHRSLPSDQCVPTS